MYQQSLNSTWNTHLIGSPTLMNQIFGTYKAYTFQRPIYGLWRGHFMSYLTLANPTIQLSGYADRRRHSSAALNDTVLSDIDRMN